MSFKHLVELTFLFGCIDDKIRDKIICFDRERNQIAHRLLKMEIPSQKLKQICSRGLQLLDALETSFSQIIPKPKFIKMRAFKIISLTPPKSGT
ncbi:hypothetical protein [Candidatus Borrarchaeum sp.]|uniref:hypothetical protein n=1 Tax=Candidatus Borrarchaeum sp. TaxID=2846742 RepID=UPI0025801FA5|nr:hypothetical protein [Candidatus Borrarchaeum sp.]